MPPIKVYTNSPINAAKAEGITPKTAAPSNNDGDSGMTQAGGNLSNIPVQIHAPLQPTPTKTTAGLGNNNPPPPQPGAVPFPRPTDTATMGPAPPAPAITQAAQLPGAGSGGEARYPTYPPPPPQMGVLLVESTAPHAYRGTSSAVPLPTGATNAAVPSTGSLGNRQVGHDSAGSYVGVGGNFGGGQPGYSPPAGGYQQRATNDNDTYQDDSGEEGVWNSAVKWAQVAGEKLSAAESEVWKRINKE
ncbi:hypothetical protein V8F33_004249 [Rhypophila sp. PSN 637]